MDDYAERIVALKTLIKEAEEACRNGKWVVAYNCAELMMDHAYELRCCAEIAKAREREPK